MGAIVKNEPPEGATVEDGRGHRWRRNEQGWIGCLACDPREGTVWPWRLVLADAADSGGLHLLADGGPS